MSKSNKQEAGSMGNDKGGGKKTYIHKTEDSLKRKTLENDPYDLYK